MKELSLFQSSTTRIEPSRRGQKATASAGTTSWWRGIADRFLSCFSIPFGYEDENGFHYGHQPNPEERMATQASSESRQMFTERACDAMVYSEQNASKAEGVTVQKLHVPA